MFLKCYPFLSQLPLKCFFMFSPKSESSLGVKVSWVICFFISRSLPQSIRRKPGTLPKKWSTLPNSDSSHVVQHKDNVSNVRTHICSESHVESLWLNHVKWWWHLTALALESQEMLSGQTPTFRCHSKHPPAPARYKPKPRAIVVSGGGGGFGAASHHAHIKFLLHLLTV